MAVGFALPAIAEPATQPSSQVAPSTASPPIRPRISILLVPHRQIDPSATTTWIAPAIRESVRGDLVRARNVDVSEVPASLVPISSDSAALSTARRIESNYVLSGTYQVVEGKVRILSTLTDVASGQIVASYKQTGEIASLFELEDDLAQEVRASLAKFTAPREPAAESPDSTPSVDQAANLAAGPLRLQVPAPRVENPYLRPYEDQHYSASRQNYFYNSGPSNVTPIYCCYGPYYPSYQWSYRISAYPYRAAPGGAASRYGAATR